MSASKTIRSLERGLKVLQALQENSISSLHDIHRLTRISKPSLLRILHTLEQSGVIISRRLADRRYRISTNLSHLARKRDRYDGVAEAAGPILDRLCQKVSWPSDLMVPAGDHLEIRESSRVRTPFAIYFMQDRIGTPVNWVLSAVGRAYLAFCPENERQKLLAQAGKPACARNQTCRPHSGRDARERIWHARSFVHRWRLWAPDSRRAERHGRTTPGSRARARRDQHCLGKGCQECR
jgi:DNA-binding IclR family transcriptional regulator